MGALHLLLFVVVQVVFVRSQCTMPPIPHHLHYAFDVTGVVPTCVECGGTYGDVEEWFDYNGKNRLVHQTVQEVDKPDVHYHDQGRSWFKNLGSGATCTEYFSDEANLVQFAGMWPGGYNITIEGTPYVTGNNPSNNLTIYFHSQTWELDADELLYYGETTWNGIDVEHYQAIHNVVILEQPMANKYNYFWKTRTNELVGCEGIAHNSYETMGQTFTITISVEMVVTLWSVGDMSWSYDQISILPDCENATTLNPTPPGPIDWYADLLNLDDYVSVCDIPGSSLLVSSSQLPIESITSTTTTFMNGWEKWIIFGLVGAVLIGVVSVSLIVFLQKKRMKKLEKVVQSHGNTPLDVDIHPGLSGFAPIVVVSGSQDSSGSHGLSISGISPMLSGMSPFSPSPAFSPHLPIPPPSLDPSFQSPPFSGALGGSYGSACAEIASSPQSCNVELSGYMHSVGPQ